MSVDCYSQKAERVTGNTITQWRSLDDGNYTPMPNFEKFAEQHSFVEKNNIIPLTIVTLI